MIKGQIVTFLFYYLLSQLLFGERDGANILSVTNWNELNVEKLALMIDNVANNRMNNQ